MHTKSFNTFLKHGCNSMWVQFHIFPLKYIVHTSIIHILMMIPKYLYIKYFKLICSFLAPSKLRQRKLVVQFSGKIERGNINIILDKAVFFYAFVKYSKQISNKKLGKK